MRNAIRNILSNWRNIFGRVQNGSQYFPVVRTIDHLAFIFGITSGNEVPLVIEEIRTLGGSLLPGTVTVNTPNTTKWVTISYADIGTDLVLNFISGSATALVVNGETIFDNR